MAFGIKARELSEWKEKVLKGEIAFITHYWLDPRFPDCKTVTKVGCSNLDLLVQWGKRYGLKKEWIHDRSNYPHYDLLGARQKEILYREGVWDQIQRFNL